MDKNYLAEILSIDKQAEKSIIDLFNQYNVDKLDVSKYHWLIMTNNFESFEIDTIHINQKSIVFFNLNDIEGVDIDDLIGSEMSRIYHLLLDNIDKLEEIKINNYYKNPQLEKYLVFVPNNYIDSQKSVVENDDNFIAMGYHFGKVLTTDEFANLYNNYQLGDLTNNDKYTMRTYTMDTKCIELCPHCVHEVLLDTKFEMQVCPVCGKKIAPCNLCSGYCLKNCPINAR